MVRFGAWLVWLLVFAFVSPALAVWHPVLRFSVIHLDPAQPDSIATFLAVVPATVRHQGGDTFQGVVTHDRLDDRSNAYLYADWGRFTAGTRIPGELLIVGDVPAAVDAKLVRGAGGARVLRTRGDAEENAAFIASAMWTSSEAVVCAPAPLSDADLEGTATAAAHASLLGAPLLFVGDAGPGASTRAALERLGAKRAVVFDTTRRLPAAALAALSAAVPVSAVATSMREAVAIARAAGAAPTLCLMQNGGQAAAAALAAARYRGTVHRVPEAVIASARRAGRRVPAGLRTTIAKLPGPVRDEESAEDMVAVARRFSAWLDALGAEDPTRLETVIDFAQGDVTSGVPLTLERAILGDPRRPTGRGALVSRMPGSPHENIAYINRTTLYPALIHVAPRRDRVTMSMVAIEVENVSADCSLHFADTDGVDHKANEFYGCHEGGYDDPGVYEAFRSQRYSVGIHNGRHEGTGEDQLGHEKLFGFWKELRDGSTFLYSSSHGGVDEFYPLGVDEGTVEAVPFGTAYWPAPEGRVNRYGDTYTYQDLDREFENLHSVVTVFNACLVGGGKLNRTVLEHGGAGSIASYTSISFDGGGMWGCWYVDRLVRDGVSLGDAFAYANARASECFPLEQTGGDSSLRFVHFGDAAMELAKPHWPRPELLEPR